MHQPHEHPTSASTTQAETQPPSRPMALVAATLPLVFSVGGCLLYPTTLGSWSPDIMGNLRDMGLVAALLIGGVTCFSAIAIAGCLYFAGRGARLPTAVPLLFATLPWLASLTVGVLSMLKTTAAAEYAQPAERAMLIAAGLSETTLSRIVGGTHASALCAATAVGLALAAVGQRAPRRSVVGALIGGAVITPIVGLALYTFIIASSAAVIVLVAALGAFLASSIAGFAIGADTPKARSAALGVSSPIAAGLAVTLAVATAWSVSLGHVFTALAYAAPESRGALVTTGLAEIGPLQLASHVSIAIALLAAAALAGWSFARVAPSRGRIVGALALLAVVGLATGADTLLSPTDSQLEALTPPPEAPSLPVDDSPPTDSRVSLGPLEDERGAGVFDPSIVTRGIHSRLHQVDDCYERELGFDPRLGGRVRVSFTVLVDGSVTGARAVENTASPALAACTVAMVSALHFDPGPELGSVAFTCPFVFAPQP